MSGYDVNVVVEATRLRDLAAELLGDARGGMFPCPDPQHGAQTGRTPPVSVFTGRDGKERWNCHACPAGGDAVDLWRAVHPSTTGEAVEQLARRAGISPLAPDVRPFVRPPAPPKPPLVFEANPVLEDYVARAHAYLLDDKRGATFRDKWLIRLRGFEMSQIVSQRLGADPGCNGADYLYRSTGDVRPRGVPRGGPGVVFPLLDDDRVAAYCQKRMLFAGDAKYLNPPEWLAPNPRVAAVACPDGLAYYQEGLVVVCEGMPDVCTAAQCGLPTVVLLGSETPDERVAAWLNARYPDDLVVLAAHDDVAGRRAASTLTGHLGRDDVVRLPMGEGANDLNDWRKLAQVEFEVQLGAALVDLGYRQPHFRVDLAAEVAPVHAPTLGL